VSRRSRPDTRFPLSSSPPPRRPSTRSRPGAAGKLTGWPFAGS